MGEQDASEDDPILVNRGKFPVSPQLWNAMWRRAEHVHPGRKKMSALIRGNDDIPEVTLPVPPTFRATQPVPEKLHLLQNYISQLEYDYTGLQFFEIRKGRPLCRLMEVAKSIIREALPIKCLEAVILAIYLSSEITAVQRFPIAFKSTFENSTFKHIVLGVYYNGKFGALGLSRRDTLMYKQLKYDTLQDLLVEFIQCYKNCFHKVDRIKIGLPVSHDNQSMEAIMWKYSLIKVAKLTHKEIRQQCDQYSKQLRGQTAHQMKYSKIQAGDKNKTVVADVSDSSSNSNESVRGGRSQNSHGSGTPKKPSR